MSSSKVSVRLNPSFDEWYGARAVVEEQLKVIGKALESIRISSQLQDAFTGHLFAVHHQWCEACPPAREPGLPAGGLEKEAPTNIPTRAAAAHNAMKQKTAVSCVSTFTQTTDINGHRLQMNAQGGDDDNNDGISETSVPLSMTCRVEDEESQADVNRTLEKPSTEKVVSTEFIKLEVLEDVQSPDVLLRLNKGHCDVDMDSSKEETPSQQIHEEELPSQHIESGDQSHLERTNTVSHQLIKQEEDSQGHCDVDMAGSSSETMSYQGPVEEIPLDTPDQQLCLEGVNKVSDQPIKHEKDSEGHCDLDMAGSSSEAVSHQEPVEEIPLDRSGGQLQLEGMNKDSGQPIKQKDSQGHCDFDMAGSSSEAMSHQGPMDEIPLDRSDGTNNTVSAVSCDVPSQEGVFKDPCLDSHKKVQETSRTDGKMKFQCSHCSNSYSFVNEYQKHLSTHTCQKPHQCAIRSKGFSGKNSFDTHMMKHKGEKHLKCDHFYYQCSAKGNLNVHLRKHTGDMPYKCSICDRRLWSKDGMKYHMSTHSGEKPFSCDICDYRCISKGHLTRHVRVHTGEKPYECSQCGKRFNQLSVLKRHKIIHTGQKPHQCSLCGKRFNQLSILQRHMMTHTGRKPHQCSLCGKRFTRVDSFKKHMKTH